MGPVDEADEAQKIEPDPVQKSFRPYDQNPMLLLPPSLDEWRPEGHMARFVSEVVEEALDLSLIYAAYTEERGYPPYDPRLMAKLLIYGYCTGQRSSRGSSVAVMTPSPFATWRRERRPTTARSRASGAAMRGRWRGSSCGRYGCAARRD